MRRALLLAPLLVLPTAFALEPGGFETWIRTSDALTVAVFVDGVETCTDTVGGAQLVSWEGRTVNVQLETPSTCGPAVTLFGGDWAQDGWVLRAFGPGLPPTRGFFATEWASPGSLVMEQDLAPGVVARYSGDFWVFF